MYNSVSRLKTKKDIDGAILTIKDKLVCFTFVKFDDPQCTNHLNILSKCEYELSNMANIYSIDIEDVPLYTTYFEVEYIPSTIFFYNTKHIQIYMSAQDNTKFVGSIEDKQDFVDLVEVLFKAGMRGKQIGSCPIPKERIPQYKLYYKDA